MWIVYRYTPVKDDSGKIVVAKETLGNIDLPADCDGDEIYDIMIEREYIGELHNYEFEGDDTGIAIMGKTEEDGDFYLEFVETEPPRVYHFMTIWKKNQPFMEKAAENLNIYVAYMPHPDSDFVLACTPKSTDAPNLIDEYHDMKEKGLDNDKQD